MTLRPAGIWAHRAHQLLQCLTPAATTDVWVAEITRFMIGAET